jgi:hypothetical protein
VEIQGKENMTWYRFATRINQKGFCKTCGVPLTNMPAPLTQEEIDNMAEGLKSMWGRITAHTPVNLRVLDGFNLGDVKPERFEGWDKIPSRYTNP